MASLSCPRCSKHFTHKSSVVRHLRRCAEVERAPSRRKACRQCSGNKVRCDLQRPACGRCRARSLACEFVRSPSAAPSAVTHVQGPSTGDEESSFSFGDATPPLAFSDESRSTLATTPPSASAPEQEHGGTHSSTHEAAPPRVGTHNGRPGVLQDIPPGVSDSDPAVRSTMQLVVRVLKSWPRLMATHHTAQLPPPIHRLQVADGVPTPLANCYALAKMWAGHTEGSRELVRKTILQEIRRLPDDYTDSSESHLLAAAQSLLMLTIMLFFGTGPSLLPHALHSELLLQIWDAKQRLTQSGLLLDQEAEHTTPPWRDWALASARRRTVHAFHHVEWAWSVLGGRPTVTCLTCFELGSLPAPPAKYLWQEADGARWRELYAGWLGRWDGGFYRMEEYFEIRGGLELDERTEMWLSEVDEFGMLAMAEVNALRGA